FRRKSWHGTNLMGSIRGIDVETAAWRPAPGKHNIWELIVHCAYWKYSVYRRLAGDPGLTFAIKGSNFFERPTDRSEAALKDDIKLLRDYHGLLIASFDAFPEDRLGDVPKGSATSFIDLVIGVAAHDLYHAGQIQLIKRLHEK
ncbi:MAG TPA: DinB family protein, partial [Pyrinomonadaceae bacterium]|nr:DinB family protein [Pyrinomonadaceae bacterium]